MKDSKDVDASSLRDARAQAFVDARLLIKALDEYPGQKPSSLVEAYRIQDNAIALWPEEIVGWKAGRITGQWAVDLGEDRLAGPVFRPQSHTYDGAAVEMPVFAAGFAAVEGEVVAVIGEDAPVNKIAFTIDEALAMIESLHIGVEVASSPFVGINDHGPLVTISDFGNNYGLILGDALPDWRDMDLDKWVFTTRINERVVGATSVAGIPGGPMESVRFLLENVARRGHPAKKGMCLLTGAVTGVHVAKVGDRATVGVGGARSISCVLIPASGSAS